MEKKNLLATDKRRHWSTLSWQAGNSVWHEQLPSIFYLVSWKCKSLNWVLTWGRAGTESPAEHYCRARLHLGAVPSFATDHKTRKKGVLFSRNAYMAHRKSPCASAVMVQGCAWMERHVPSASFKFSSTLWQQSRWKPYRHIQNKNSNFCTRLQQP